MMLFSTFQTCSKHKLFILNTASRHSMIPLKKNYHKEVSLKISLTDDFWYLSHIIEPGDEIISKTERKIKIGTPDGKMRVTRKTIVLKLRIEEVTLGDEGTLLRVKGKVTRGPEDVPIGSYHSFSFGVGDSFTLLKETWPKYKQKLLEEAIKNSANTYLIVLFDREEAIYSLVQQTGIRHLREVKLHAKKKQYDKAQADDSFEIITKHLLEDEKQYQPQTIICASPAFWKKYVEEKIPQELRKKVVFLETGTVHKGEVFKILKRPELQSILENHQLRKEELFVEKILKQLDKELVVYGLQDVQEASENGAIEELGVTEELIKKTKEENNYEDLDKILKTIDAGKGIIHFLHSEQTAKVIDSFGGIVGILRWKQ